MTIGAGIGIVGIWVAAAIIATNKDITSRGAGLVMFFALLATLVISTVKS